MNKIIIKLGKIILSQAIFFSLLSCDVEKGDVRPLEFSTDVYTYSNDPIVIYPNALIKGADLRIGEIDPPASGTIEKLMDGKYLLYTPSIKTFQGDTDIVTIPLHNNEGNIAGHLKTQFIINSDECNKGNSGVYDFGRVPSGTTLEIDLFENDHLCFDEITSGFVIQEPIENYTPFMNVNLEIGPGKSAKLTYTAPEGFTGTVKFIYHLGINALDPGSTVPLEQLLDDPLSYYEAYVATLVEIEVVD